MKIKKCKVHRPVARFLPPGKTAIDRRTSRCVSAAFDAHSDACKYIEPRVGSTYEPRRGVSDIGGGTLFQNSIGAGNFVFYLAFVSQTVVVETRFPSRHRRIELHACTMRGRERPGVALQFANGCASLKSCGCRKK